MTSSLLGGIGLFLLGMTLMTEALRTAAGGALRDLLSRFTGGPIQAFFSGAALTAVVQSSTATVIMTIGFVSAGLLTFAQSIGVVFGAAVGTTSTSWLVAFLGLRYSVSVVALPLVGIGALIRLFAKGRLASVGMVIAGFGLIFVGVDTLQSGMEALSGRIQLGAISGTTLGGSAILVAIGFAVTVVMQSSTAAVATTLAALHTGTVDLPQAAALVIGHNVGTTLTAGIAAIGASVPAKRTALSHILLNSFSGIIAFTLLPVHLSIMAAAQSSMGAGPAPLIALFHTAINVVGVAVLLPVTTRYAALISRLVPDRAPSLSVYLDTSLLSVPSVAVEAARRTVVQIGAVLVEVTCLALRSVPFRRHETDLLQVASTAAAQTRGFLGRIRSSPDDEKEYNRHLSVLHAVDHLDRLLEALHDSPTPDTLAADSTLVQVSTSALEALDEASARLEAGGE